MKTKSHDELVEIFSDDEKISERIRQGVRDALERHRQRGHLVCVWQDGKVVWVRPETPQP